MRKCLNKSEGLLTKILELLYLKISSFSLPSTMSFSAPINRYLNVVVRFPTLFRVCQNGCWPFQRSQLPRALPRSNDVFAVMLSEQPSLIAKARAKTWQAKCSSLSPKYNSKFVCSFLRFITGSSFSSSTSSSNVRNCFFT